MNQWIANLSWPASEKTRYFICALIAMASTVVNASPEECSQGDLRSSNTYSVTREEKLRISPSQSSAFVVNRKASEALRSLHDAAIDTSTRVQVECVRQAWSRVHVVEPEWLSNTHIGWVPSEILRSPTLDDLGRLIYTEQDFAFDKRTTPYKQAIIRGVNKVARTNQDCERVDPLSAYLSDTRGSPKDPVFFVTCEKAGKESNVYFSKSFADTED